MTMSTPMVAQAHTKKATTRPMGEPEETPAINTLS